MKIGVIEFGGNLTERFIRAVSAQIATADFKRKKALDMFDALAFAKQFTKLDHIVIIGELDPEEKDKNSAFYRGLADLEADTGKPIFKLLYFTDEEPDVEAFVQSFVDYLFRPEKPREEAPAEEAEGGEFGMPGSEEGFPVGEEEPFEF